MSLFGNSKMPDWELERDFQERVTHLLRSEGWRVYSVPDSRRASMAGFPDICAWNVRRKRLLFAELKREKGRVSDAQRVTMAELEQVAEMYLWRPSDWPEIIRIVREHDEPQP